MSYLNVSSTKPNRLHIYTSEPITPIYTDSKHINGVTNTLSTQSQLHMNVYVDKICIHIITRQ